MTVTRARNWGELAVELQAKRFEYVAPVAESVRVGRVLAVATGVLSNTENGVVSRGDSIAAGLAVELVEWFRERGLPASWVQAGGAASDAIRDDLLAAGCREETSGVDMGRDLERLGLDALPPEDVSIERVDAEQDVDAWLEAAAECGWLDGEVDRLARRRLFLALGLGQDAGLLHWVAWRGGRPVGFATAFYWEDAVLLEHLGVVAGERQRGVGRALVAARIGEARRRGVRRAVLAPSPDGARLYRGLGFDSAPSLLRRWFYLPLEAPPGLGAR